MNIIKKLQDPILVVKFQQFFGAYLEKTETTRCKAIYSSDVLEKKGKTNETQKPEKLKYEKSNKFSTLLLGDGMVGSSEEPGINDSVKLNQSHVVTNWFWFYFFSLATQTGDELFYITFFPFWKWNVDGAVFRQLIYLWLVTMYIGQALKDLLKVPRPSSPPVACLDTKWRLEYGLPSTHAMVACVIPFSLVLLCMHRYQLNGIFWFTIAFFWCLSVCLSRIYLGMHSVLDILVGLLLASGLLALCLPWITSFDHFMLIHPLSPLISITLSIAMIVCYPPSDKWNSARGDTTVIVGVGCGCLVGSWLNYQLGIISEPYFQPPFTVVWPTFLMCCLGLLRTFLGVIILIAVRAIFKHISLRAICHLLNVSPSDYKNDPTKVSSTHRLTVELFYKFITYTCIGFTIVFSAPLLFNTIGIERPMFYTEM